MKEIVLFFIVFYQKYLSFDTGLPKKLGFSRGFVCMHYPTCSEYTRQAVVIHGVQKGVYLGYKRILTCRPGGTPRVDPVPLNTKNT